MALYDLAHMNPGAEKERAGLSNEVWSWLFDRLVDKADRNESEAEYTAFLRGEREWF